jgi:hypothetical protein
MSEQKFRRGDLVKIADDLGPTMSHFRSGMRAVVEYSYAEKYGGNDNKSYSLHVEGTGSSSWYKEYQLIMIAQSGFHAAVALMGDK